MSRSSTLPCSSESRTRVRILLERLNLLLVARPRRARYPEERPRGRVRDVADARRVLRLRDVDRMCERVRGHGVPRDHRVVADVQSLDAPEDQRRCVLARLGDDDVDCLEELGAVSGVKAGEGARRTSHSMLNTLSFARGGFTDNYITPFISERTSKRVKVYVHWGPW